MNFDSGIIFCGGGDEEIKRAIQTREGAGLYYQKHQNITPIPFSPFISLPFLMQ